MLVFECPGCQSKLQAAEEHAGKAIQCPQCQQLTKVPGGATDAISAQPMPASVPPPVSPTAVTTPDQVAPRSQRRDDDDERLPPRERPAAKAGMGVAAILLIVFGISCCVVVPVLIGLLVPAVQKVREAAARTHTSNNLKQIGLACHTHHDMTRAFPTPKSPKGDLSWRVTVLPFVEQAHLFNQINPNSRWDDPPNRLALSSRPPIYDSPNQPPVAPSDTLFQYFTGPKTMFEKLEQPIQLQHIIDGTSNTFLTAQSSNGVPWTKPADMAVTPDGPLPLPQQFLVVFADGSVRFFDRRRTNDMVLRLAIDPRDGQVLPPDFGH